jgi:hypothetical protein
VRVTVTPRGAPDVRLRAQGTGRVRVRLEPADASTVLAAQRAAELPVGARRDGRDFIFDALPLGTYEIYTEARAGRAEVVSLTRDGETRELTMRLALEVLSGRVVDSRGEGVPEIWVSAAAHGSAVARLQPRLPVLTDADGAFQIPNLPEGNYDLFATDGAGEGRLANVPSGAGEVLLRLQRYASLSGTVTTETGDPLPAFELSFSREPEGDGGSLLGTDGRWSLSGLLPGSYTIAVSAGRGSVQDSASVGEGDALSLALVLRANPHGLALGAAEDDETLEQPR